MTDEKTSFLTPADHAASGTAPACVVQIYGGMIGRRFELSPRELVVGRGDDCDITVDLTTVSRRHARLYNRDRASLVEDLGSTNGTFVNDEEVSGARELKNGDLVKFGSAVFKFIDGGNVEALYHEEIHRLAITDGLTGLANKRAFLEFLEREITRAKRHARPLSLVMFDIDHFKKVNDELGHLAGDQVLRVLATALSATIRGDELFARYGGEEFAVVLPETSGEQLGEFGERIRRIVEESHSAWEGQAIGVTISVGTAEMEREDTVETLIARADKRLYAAKHGGRNRVVG